MKLVFVSNFLTHHQIPVANELYNVLGDQYAFVQMEEMSDERMQMGWNIDETKFSYLVHYCADVNQAQRLINDAEVVIIGAASDKVIQNRLKKNLIIFRYEERPFKKNDYVWMKPRTFRMMVKCHTMYRKKNVYMLCAGAYTECDMKKFRAYPNKMFAWGYFPFFYDYGLEGPIKRRDSKLRLLWVARMIEWKHPEMPIQIADYLRRHNVAFQLTMIGKGELRENVIQLIKKYDLERYTRLIECVPNDEVYRYMLDADVFIMSSDRNEGWGAVVNEAMNQGCIMIANKAVGSVPWLIEDGVNGFVYKQVSELEAIIDRIINLSDEELAQMHYQSYRKIREEWNPIIAAHRLLDLIENPDRYRLEQAGVCRRL